jgi:hypothetical protein
LYWNGWQYSAKSIITYDPRVSWTIINGNQHGVDSFGDDVIIISREPTDYWEIPIDGIKFIGPEHELI